MRISFVGCGLVVALLAVAVGAAQADSVVPITPHLWCTAEAAAGPTPVYAQDWNAASATGTYWSEPPRPQYYEAQASVTCAVQADGSLWIGADASTTQGCYAIAGVSNEGDSTFTIGTSAAYPAGTPLLASIHAAPYHADPVQVFRADGTRILYLPDHLENENASFSVVAGESLRILLSAYAYAGMSSDSGALISVAAPEPTALGLLLALGLVLRRR